MGSSRQGQPRKGEKTATIDINTTNETSNGIDLIEPIICHHATLNIITESSSLENCDVIIVTSPVIHIAESIQ
jgi:hypothetical protein